MSTDSQSETKLPSELPTTGNGMGNIADAVLKFETHDTENFHAEFAAQGDDLIYHFWPPGEKGRFGEGFASHLENGFVEAIPAEMEVHAAFTDFDEASLRLKEGVGLVPQKDMHKELVAARETYYVRVLDGLKNPMAETFLKKRVFDFIDSEISRSL